MKIEKSSFYEFTQKGAISVELTSANVNITDSVFSRCHNIASGGAISVSISKGNCFFERDCGTECYTTKSDDANDFGQFVCVECSSGQIRYESLAVSLCPSWKVATKNNGPIGFIGEATLLCSHSNSSNNLCYIGPGFASMRSDPLTISYVNFANDTTYYGGTNYWVAAVFHQALGTVALSNFVNCASSVTSPAKPPGTFSQCMFWNCINYGVNLLPADNKVGSPRDFSFPLKCPARLVQNLSQRNDRKASLVIILEMSLTGE